MKWYREWQQRRLEQKIMKALIAMSQAEENYRCIECDGTCEVCDKDSMNCE